MIIAIDFDGTIAEHCYPELGLAVPGAFKWMKAFQEAGANLILWTMRSDGREDGSTPLGDAVAFCRANGVEFYGINGNPTQHKWTASPKAYAQLYIDDAAFGCPLRESPRMGARAFVDWDVVGPAVMALIAKGE